MEGELTIGPRFVGVDQSEYFGAAATGLDTTNTATTTHIKTKAFMTTPPLTRRISLSLLKGDLVRSLLRGNRFQSSSEVEPGDRRKPPSEFFQELVTGKFRLFQDSDQCPFRQFLVVRNGDQDASLIVPQVNVTPRLPDDHEPKLPEDFEHFPRGQDGKLGQESDLDVQDPGAPTPRCQLE